MNLISILTKIFLHGFIVGGMLAVGTSLTLEQIKKPLTNTKQVSVALLASFIVSPLLGYALTKIFHLDTDMATGLMLLSLVAGGPFLLKISQIGKCNIADSVGLMMLLMAITIIYTPVVMPLILPDVSISAWQIAKPLIFLMLIPLSIGLFFKAHYPKVSGAIQPVFIVISNISLVLLMTLSIVKNWDKLVSSYGTGAYLSVFIYVLALFAVSYFMGGRDRSTRLLIGLSAGQRNLGASVAIAGLNFSDRPKVMIIIIVAAIVGFLLLTTIAWKLGRYNMKHP